MNFIKRSLISISAFCLAFLLIGCSGSTDGGADVKGDDSPAVYYTVTFNSQGGSSVGTLSVTEGSKVTEPSIPLRINYIFGGWYSQPACSESYRWYFSSYSITKDTILYAKWTARSKYKVIYVGNGSTDGVVPVDNNEYYTGDSFTVLSKNTLVKVVSGIDFIFLGWHHTEKVEYSTPYQPGQTLTIGGGQLPSNADVIMYAQWTAIKQTGPAGGTIFYDKGEYSDGWRFMEVAPLSTEWTNIEWGYCDSHNPKPSMTTDGIGAGLQNTINIVAFHNAINYYNTYNSGYPNYANGTVAAKLCYDLVVTNNSVTYDDWFLPSYNEMEQIWKLKNVGGFGGSSSYTFYWTSTEWIQDPANCYTAHGSWFQNSVAGGSSGNKSEERRVRAVRRF